MNRPLPPQATPPLSRFITQTKLHSHLHKSYGRPYYYAMNRNIVSSAFSSGLTACGRLPVIFHSCVKPHISSRTTFISSVGEGFSRQKCLCFTIERIEFDAHLLSGCCHMKHRQLKIDTQKIYSPNMSC